MAPETSFRNTSFHISSELLKNGDTDVCERLCAGTMKTMA